MEKKAATKNQTITVKVSEENPESLELIAKSIIEVSRAFKAIQQSRLTQRAVVLLLQDMTRLGQKQIESILNAGPRLEAYYTKEIKKG